MTEQEAIERLKDHFKIHNDGRPTPYLDKAVRMSISALKKNIGKKPTQLIDIACPSCGLNDIQKFDENGDLYWRYDYCPHCGQKIDWSKKV